jgi:hypothetical protein
MSPRTVAVARPVRAPKVPVSDHTKAIHDFLYNRSVARAAGKLRDAARDVLKPWFDSNPADVTVNDTGSKELEFDAPLLIDGVKYTGLVNVRKESSVLDLDKLDNLFDTMDPEVRARLHARVMKTVTDIVVDPDELFAANQEGVITDAQLDSLFTTEVSWSLGVKQD